MRKLSKLNLTHSLIPWSGVAVILLILLRGRSNLQFLVVMISVVIYLFISLIHHHFDKSLTFEVLVEYILIAVLTLIILQGILL